MPVVEEMKSLHKVYKSANVTLGQKKSLEYTQVYTESVPQQVDNEITEEIQLDVELEIQNRINEAELECERMIEQAQVEVNQILAEAYDDSKAIMEKAKEDGYQDGFEQGKKEGFNLYNALIDEVNQLKQEVYKYKRETAKQLEKDIVKLIIDSINKIINHELNENNELILNVIKVAIDKCTFTESLIIRVSEDDFETVNSSINRIYMMTEGIDQVEIKCDKFLKSGSVVIDTVSGKIDASIETQIKQIENAFNELLRSE